MENEHKNKEVRQNKFEKATVYSKVETCDLAEEKDSTLWSDNFSLVLVAIASEIKNQGGFIGHLKAVLEFEPGGQLGFSIVKDEVSCQGKLEAGTTLTMKMAITAIIYGLERDTLEKLVNKKLTPFLPGQRKVVNGSGASKTLIPMW